MARYGSDHKREAHDEIVRVASRRLRNEGLAAVGVRSMMADAGLTHGAFYAHFGSRDDLIAEAIELALANTAELLTQVVARADEGRKLEALVHAYLHPQHRTDPGQGCAIAALGPEIARQPDEARQAFSGARNGIVRLIEENLPPGGTTGQRKSRALAMFGGMIGTLQLMRIAGEESEARMVMQAGREAALLIGGQPWPMEVSATAPC